MKRWACGLLLLASVVSFTSQAQAGGLRYPPRHKYSSYYKHINVPQRDGQVKSKYVYRGYESGFPPPAIMYYGYPHSGDDGGGFNGVSRWSP